MELLLNLEQQQVLSQKMIQSAEILQMASAQLEEYLQEQERENPVLELNRKNNEDPVGKELEKYKWISSHDEQNRYLYEKIQEDEEEYPEVGDPDKGETLQDHLWDQLISEKFSPTEEKAIRYMIGTLDAKGYFTEDPETVSRSFSLPKEKIKDLLSRIQTLEPDGIGSANLAECLCIQLKKRGELNERRKNLIMEHLEDIARNRMAVLAKKLEVSLDTILSDVAMIRTLDPKPGARFQDVRQPYYIVPDVVIARFAGHQEILLNESLYPEINFNNQYVRMCDETDDEEAKTYLMDKIRRVEWLKQCINRRNETLLAVTREILKRQEDFFLYGSRTLKPLRMAEVAEAIGVHESTVSRAVNQKYLQCIRGVFPMNYFFAKSVNRTGETERREFPQEDRNRKRTDFTGNQMTTGTGSSSNRTGEEATAERTANSTGYTSTDATPEEIQNCLRELIAAENKKKPKSDRILCEELEAAGYSISRRTVAKYREAIGIPGTSVRRQY